jgi:hypothetical protein
MSVRSVLRVVLPVVVLIVSLLLPSSVMAGKPVEYDTTKDVKALIETYGPIVVYHPDEQYFPDMPEAVLDGPSQLVWGIVRNEDDYATFEQTILGSTETSADTLLADVAMAKQDPNASDPNFRYWLNIDPSLRAGHLQRAKTYVRVLPAGDLTLDLQFWFFAPYNGPVKGKAHVNVAIPGYPQPPDTYYFPETVGRHTGDWEQVTLRFERQQVTDGWTLASLFLSQHSGGEWVAATSPALAYSGTHPVVYAARDSHANYASIGEHPFDRVVSQSIGPVTLTVDLVDLTGDGATFEAYRPGNYTIVTSALPGVKANGARDWLEYDGPWGAYEKLSYTGTITIPGMTRSFTFAGVGNGPPGPVR